jgi:hypothetical protein
LSERRISDLYFETAMPEAIRDVCFAQMPPVVGNERFMNAANPAVKKKTYTLIIFSAAI